MKRSDNNIAKQTLQGRSQDYRGEGNQRTSERDLKREIWIAGFRWSFGEPAQSRAGRRQAVCIYSVSTGPGPGPLRSNIASVQSRNICWTGLGPHVAFAMLLFCLLHINHTSHRPQKKKATDVTASIG